MISRLVSATTPSSTICEFPDESAVFTEGWDGIVNCKDDSGIVPMGISLWEFGTEANPKGKADGDYKKRTNAPLGYNQAECTFIFLTLKQWRQKEKWRQAKLKERIWHDVRVYDAANISDWLDKAPAVSRWLSIFIRSYPSDGLLTVERFWKEWAERPDLKLNPNVVTSGREFQSRQLEDFLSNAPAIRAIRAFSKDEAIAFIIASAMQFQNKSNLNFFSRSLIVDTAPSFRSVSINKSSLILISRFEETGILYGGVSDGHHVLVPLGPDDPFNQDTIDLPQIERDGQIRSLVDSGMSENDATRYSKESARNVTILKRLLRFSQDKIESVPSQVIRTFIPAMLIGRWSESKVGDKALIEKLSGQSYGTYITELEKLKDFEFAPFITIGDTWRLASPMDAWTNLAAYITKRDLELLKEAFLNAFEKGNPIIEPPKNAPMFAFLSKETVFSNWAREGLVQSLILLGLYGDSIKIRNIGPTQEWVDRVVKELFDKADNKLWISLNNEMPLIAEASPDSFIEACFQSLQSKNTPIMAMFGETQGFVTTSANHTGLLWALEGLAWEPEYLHNSVLLLSELAARDPGGKLGNRPINSLLEIFKPWHFQTFANFEERVEALKLIALRQKNIAWDLLIKLLPRGSEAAFGTHKMRWRMFDRNFNKNYYLQEILNMHSALVDILIDSFDNSEQKLSRILDSSVHFSQSDRRKTLDFVESVYSHVSQVEFSAWTALREIISFQKSFPNSEISMLNEEIGRYEELYSKLTPSKAVDKYIWLFNDGLPRLPEGYIEDRNISYEKRQEDNIKVLERKRIEGLKEIISQNSLSGAINLAEVVKVPATIGSTLAHLIENSTDIFFLMDLLNTQNKQLTLVQSFIRVNFFLKGENWTISLYKKLKNKNFENKALANFLVPLPLTSGVFSFINKQNNDVKREFWTHVYPNFYGLLTDEKIGGIDCLVKYNRFFTAINISSYDLQVLPSKLIFELLLKAATEQANEEANFDSYQIGLLFEEIDKRNDVGHDKLIQLEWLYLPILASYGSQRNPKRLHDELSNNPQFFIDVLKFLYIPKSKKMQQKEKKGLSDELIQNRGQQAYKLLESWKGIPGMSQDGSIDKAVLSLWIDNARTIAERAERLEVADMQIGKILAHYPEKDKIWPPDEIADLIESINTDSLKENYRSELFNKRGFSSRAMDSGGDVEREHAKYFEELAMYHRSKHPIMSSIFKSLSKGYLIDAKRQDDDAERNKLEY